MDQNTKEVIIPNLSMETNKLVDPVAEEEIEELKIDEEPEVIEENQDEVKAEKFAKLKLFFNKNKKIILIVGVLIVLLILGTLITVLAMQEEEIVYEQMTIKETINNFNFEEAGIIKTDVLALYSKENTSLITLDPDKVTVAADDVVENGDTLFTYIEEVYEEDLSLFYKTSGVSGVVFSVTTDNTKIATAVYGSGAISSNDYTAAVNKCAVYETTISSGEKLTGSGYVDSFTSIGDDNVNVIVKLNEISHQFTDEGNVTIYLADDTLSSESGCENLGYNGTQISYLGTLYEPEYRLITGEIDITFTDVSSDLDSAPTVENLYHFVSKKSNVEIGDEVVSATNLYTHSYNKGNLVEKTMATAVNGLIKEVTATNDKIEITLYNTDENYLSFPITEEYTDKIAVSMEAIVEINDLTITTEINDIKDNTGTIENGNFKSFSIDDTGIVKITGTSDPIIIVPKDYIVDSKVKLVSGEEITEQEVTYDIYNEDKYIITDGISIEDVIQSYN